MTIDSSGQYHLSSDGSILRGIFVGLLSPGGLSYHQRGQLMRANVVHVPPDAAFIAGIPGKVVVFYVPLVEISDFFKYSKHFLAQYLIGGNVLPYS